MKKLLLVTLLIATVPTPALSQTLVDQMIQRIGRKKAPAAAPATTAPLAAAAAFPLDIASVRLGMTADEARAALIRAGYRIAASNGTTYGPSFAAQVRAEAAQRRTGAPASPTMTDRVVTSLVADGPNREAASIGLTATPDGGSTVTSVTLTVPQDVMTGEAFLRQAIGKYGKPDGGRDIGLTQQWCSPALKSACGALVPFGRRPEALPNLVASTVLGRNTLRLKDGTEQEQARAQGYAAAVEQAAPRTNHAAF